SRKSECMKSERRMASKHSCSSFCIHHSAFITLLPQRFELPEPRRLRWWLAHPRGRGAAFDIARPTVRRCLAMLNLHELRMLRLHSRLPARGITHRVSMYTVINHVVGITIQR